jgi:tetratricopeptide (TPR) repeat protein
MAQRRTHPAPLQGGEFLTDNSLLRFPSRRRRCCITMGASTVWGRRDMATEERFRAYVELIEALLACEQGQEAEILQANFEWVDAGLVATMRERAAALLAEGEENNGRWLNHFAEQVESALASLPSLEGSGVGNLLRSASTLLNRLVGHSSDELAQTPPGGDEQEYLNFLQQLMQSITENEGNQERVYPLLQANLGLIDNTLAQLIQGWGQQTLSQTAPEEQREVGAFFYEIGQIFYGFDGGNPKVNMTLAVISYELCAATGRQLGLERDLSTILTNLGNAYQIQAQLGINPQENLTSAIGAYQEAAQIVRQPGLERDLSSTLTNLGVAYLTQAQLGINPAENLSAAIGTYQEAAQIRRQPGLERDLSQTLNNLGIAYRNQAELGINPQENLTSAIGAYQEAAQIRRQPGLERDLSQTLNNLGNAYKTQAELGINPQENLTSAIGAYQEAAQIRRQPGLERDLSGTLTNLGNAYLTQAQLGINPQENLTSAMVAYEEAAQILRQPGLERDLSTTLTCLGIAQLIALSVAETPQARVHYLEQASQALEEAESLWRLRPFGPSLLQRHILPQKLIAGREMVQKGNWQQGLKTLQSCLDPIQKLEDPPLYAQALYEMGRAQEMLSDWASARLYYRDGLRYFTDLDDRAGQAKCRQGLGSALASQGYLDKGLTELKAALCLYQDLEDGAGQAQAQKLIESIQTVQQRQPTLPASIP